MQMVKHNSIGVGLNCSKILTESLKGKIEFIDTKPGSLAIKVSIPVKAIKSITNRKKSDMFEHAWFKNSG